MNIGTVDGAAKVNDKYLQTSYKLTPVLDPYASKVDLTETVDGWFDGSNNWMKGWTNFDPQNAKY